MQRPIKRGASGNAGLIFHIFAQDSASTTGAGKASVGFGSWACRYIRNGEAISGAITPEDITTIGTYAAPTANTNIRIKAVDNTNMIGIYEIQIHADWVNTTNSCQSTTIYLTASGVAVLPIQIPLVAYDPQDTVRLGLTALPNAAAEAAGGLYTRGSGAGQLNQSANGQVDVNVERLNNVAQSLLDLKDFADAGYDPATDKVQGVVLVDTLTTYTGNTLQTGDVFPLASTEIADIKAKTDNLPSDPADQSLIIAATDAILAKLPAALVSGRMDSSVGAMAANTLTASALATDARDEIADQVWASGTRTLTAFGFSVIVGTNSDKTGYTLSAPGIQAIWDALTSALTTVGSIGKLIVDNLNATVSSRSSHAAADVWAVGTRTLTSFGTLVSDTATAVWAAGTRTLTSFGTLVSDIWAAVADSAGVTTLLSRLTAQRATNLDSIPPRIKKNTALANFEFEMVLSSDHVAAGTGLTVTAQRSIDGGAYGACANSVSEVGSGTYKINLAASDLNGDVITFMFTAPAADARKVTIVTQV
jgi:hypothetical protein